MSAEVKSMKEWALYYAELGLAVFPLAYRNKVPAIEGGCKAATTEKSKIERWWNQNPRYNIGIATGNKSTCPNISEISKKTKIPRPTIYTVIHSDSFQRKYSEARNEAVTGAIAYLQGKLGECAAVLVNTAIDTEVPAQIRVNAANAALSQCSQWTKNVDMIERLETMEELMSRVEQEQKSQKRGK